MKAIVINKPGSILKEKYIKCRSRHIQTIMRQLNR